MKTNHLRWAIGVLATVSALGMMVPAWADNDRHDWRDERREHWRDQRDYWHWRRAAERREWERRDWERQRAAAHWRFERDRGWRFEHRPGYWSPHFVWWKIDGRPVLRPIPTARIVRYQTGYYELLGDGIAVPYHWVWRPTVRIATPPPPLPVAPSLPYDFPSGYYPPPPQG